MSLTEEQKRKIEEEERYRASLRSEVHNYQKPKKKGIGCFNLIGILFLSFVLLIAVSMYRSNGIPPSNTTVIPSPKASKNTDDLVGNVNFDGAQFNMTNQEAIDWEHCWTTLNKYYFYPSNAPAQKFNGVKAGETITFSPGEFTKKDGTRFNAFSIKPQGMSMDCDGRFGYWAWN